MKYFYYGTEPENRKSPVSYHTMEQPFRENYGMIHDEELVIEEDTIYEIDQECEACRQKRQAENPQNIIELYRIP